MMIYILTALGAYLLGSVPFGLVLARLAGYGDIRKIGSGNIGATNVLRTGNKPLALATLLLDSGKGAIAVLLAWQFGDATAAKIAALFSILGHCFPVWLGFKGGKGVATTLGTLAALNPWLGLASCGLWLVMAGLFRVSSLSALTAIGLSPVTAWFILHDPLASAMCAAIAALVFIRHKENIRRLLKGQEPRIGKKKDAA